MKVNYQIEVKTISEKCPFCPFISKNDTPCEFDPHAKLKTNRVSDFEKANIIFNIYGLYFNLNPD